MKFSVIVALSIAALASAQTPAKGPPKASGGPPKGAGGAPKGGSCAASCLMAPMQSSGCKLTGLFPKGAGASGMGGFPKGGAGGIPKGGAGGLPKPASGGMAGMSGMNMLVARQGDATAPKPTGAPKFSITPEQQAAIASARSCFCAAPALKSAVEQCVPSSCATAGADAAAGAAKMINGMCKGVANFVPMTAAPAAAAAPTPA